MFQVQNLTFRYHTNQTNILKNLTLSIEKGDFVLICGKSGCGKTTFLRHLKKSLLPLGKKTGTILYKQKDIQEVSFLQETEIGYVFQNPSDQLVMDQVWHEIAFGLENQGMELSLMKRRVSEIVNYFNLQDILYQSVNQLSGGQKQMVNLASIMAMNPEVILLDEATAQLDPIHAVEFVKMLQQIHNDFNITIVMVEHQLENVLNYVKKMVVMEQGEILFQGECQEIIKQMLKTGKLVELLPEYMQLSIPSKQLVTNLQQAKQVVQSLAFHSEIAPCYQGQKVAVEMKNINFGYQQDIIKHLQLEIYQDDFLVIVGANGCGKTTLLKCLADLVKYQGKIKYTERKRIGYLPQDPTTLFLKPTVKEELEAVCQEQSKVKEMLEWSHLLGQQESHPYDLSGGQRQLLALTKILLLEPSILLLDEPTKGLDVYAKRRIGNLLLTLSSTLPIVCVSHDLEFCAQYSKRAAMLFNGQIEAIEDTHSFFKNNLFYTTAMSKVMRNIAPDIVCYKDIVYET